MAQKLFRILMIAIIFSPTVALKPRRKENWILFLQNIRHKLMRKKVCEIERSLIYTFLSFLFKEREREIESMR